MKRVLVLAQVPPPFHGQAVMQRFLVDDDWRWCEKIHVPLDFSRRIDEVGRPAFGKLWRLGHVLLQCLAARLKAPIDVLYYPPSGSSWTGLLRDVLALLVLRRLARRTVFHFHAGGFAQSLDALGGPLRFVADLALSRPDAAIVLSESLIYEVEAIAPMNIEVIPNGIKDQWPNGQPSRKDLPFRVLFVGMVTEDKGVGILLRAAAAVLEAGVDITVDVVGEFADPIFESEVRGLLGKSELGSRVVLHGRKTGDEKWALFETASVFCFPTFYPRENQPVAVIEAMMAGLPIVTTNWRALPDMVREGREGLLVPTRDHSPVARALQDLARGSGFRATLGRNARVRFEKRFRLEDHLGRIERVVRVSAGS